MMHMPFVLSHYATAQIALPFSTIRLGLLVQALSSVLFLHLIVILLLMYVKRFQGNYVPICPLAQFLGIHALALQVLLQVLVLKMLVLQTKSY